MIKERERRREGEQRERECKREGECQGERESHNEDVLCCYLGIESCAMTIHHKYIRYNIVIKQ